MRYTLHFVTELVAITVATEETDGFRRFINSAKKYKVSVTVILSHFMNSK